MLTNEFFNFIIGSNDVDRKSSTGNPDFIGENPIEHHALDQQQQILEVLSLIDSASESMCLSDIYTEQMILHDNKK